PGARTGTQEVLLDRDIAESILLAGVEGGKLLGDADQIMKRLRQSLWYKGRIYNRLSEKFEGMTLFSDAGDRNPGTGEHIVWVQPLFEKGGRILHRANISIWGTKAEDIHRWFIRPKIAPPV